MSNSIISLFSQAMNIRVWSYLKCLNSPELRWWKHQIGIVMLVVIIHEFQCQSSIETSKMSGSSVCSQCLCYLVSQPCWYMKLKRTIVIKCLFSIQTQGRNNGENLVATSAMVGTICPTWWG